MAFTQDRQFVCHTLTVVDVLSRRRFHREWEQGPYSMLGHQRYVRSHPHLHNPHKQQRLLNPGWIHTTYRLPHQWLSRSLSITMPMSQQWLHRQQRNHPPHSLSVWTLRMTHRRPMHHPCLNHMHHLNQHMHPMPLTHQWHILRIHPSHPPTKLPC
jgi:hypothetical protein